LRLVAFFLAKNKQNTRVILMKKIFLGCITIAVSLVAGCGVDTVGTAVDDELTTSRPFYMGFTSVPYQNTMDAINDTNSRISANADIITHTLSDGIPWDEAFNNNALPNELLTDLQNKASQFTTEKTVVSLDIINRDRTNIIGAWSSEGVVTSQAPWSGRDFSSQEVVTAYVNYAIKVIDELDADYLIYGEEANLLLLNAPDTFTAFVGFAQAVYNELKIQRPEVDLLFSVALRSPDSIETASVIDRMDELVPFTDIVGLSVYPYRYFSHSNLSNPESLPSDWLSHMRVISQGKPLAVTQTGWIAEDLNLESDNNFAVAGTAELQEVYLELLFKSANEFAMPFITWYSIVDTDTLISDATTNTSTNMTSPDAFRQDTGLLDQTLTARAAFTTWQSRFTLNKL